jgi:hypothetical protein
MSNWLDDLDDRQLVTLLRHLEKANPPPVLYRYRAATEWAIKEIANHEVHVTAPDSMNDPFEYSAPLRIDRDRLKEAFEEFCRDEREMDDDAIAREWATVGDAHVEGIIKGIGDARQNSGVVCCTTNPTSNRMWGYYASSHRGICIGYDTRFHPFMLAFQVIYDDPSEPMEVIDAWKTDCTKFCDHIARRKGKEWEFEQEYRIPVGPIPDDHTRLLPVDPHGIAEIRLGVKIDSDFKTQVLEAVRKLPVCPRVIQMECDFKGFQLVERIIA